jgi:S1-C subfamily serine protease
MNDKTTVADVLRMITESRAYKDLEKERDILTALRQADLEKIAALREALEFYAKGNHIASEFTSGNKFFSSGGEDGRKARQALQATAPGER